MALILQEDYERFREHSINNKNELSKGELAACYYCCAVLRASEIDEWCDGECDGDGTAICNKCGVDTVIGEASGLPIKDIDFLKGMHYWGFEHGSPDKIAIRLPVDKIVLKELKCLGGPCPWQWEGETDDGRDVFIRERWGVFRIEIDGDVWMQIRADIDKESDLMEVCGDYLTFEELG